eukprot:CAMPEP_0119295102 /NCGR_PEP_ID=MMETSP1329-20130426/49233_1 /TAXON_ID=114041 /ORGANISM="Genus nov. species nov., Strain RCC1024" /LENGTH=54 /DNA_ID=CAMNT_0007296013 /DNA_START=51 /DNA_END=212 /DNA_ORIENTATION=+
MWSSVLDRASQAALNAGDGVGNLLDRSLDHAASLGSTAARALDAVDDLIGDGGD